MFCGVAQVPIASMESSSSIGGGEARGSVLAETAQGEGDGEELVRAEAKPLACDAAPDDVEIDTEEASVEPRVGNATGKAEKDRGNSGASQDGAQGAGDEEMKESAEQNAEGLSNSSDRNTGGWEENAEDDEERREVKGRGRVTPKGSAHNKGAFQPGSRAALSKVHLTASAGFLFFFNQYVAVMDSLLIGDRKCRARVWTKEKERNRRMGTKKKRAMYMIYRSMMMRRRRTTTVRGEIAIDTDTASSSN